MVRAAAAISATAVRSPSQFGESRLENSTFIHEDKTFEVRVAILDGRYCVKVFLAGAQVSPEYSATLEVGQDYFRSTRRVSSAN